MQLYHILNRGVDGRDIFLDVQDYARFVHDLYEFNDSAPALEYSRVAPTMVPDVGRTTSHIRDRLVDIHGWVLMRNHFHLLISECTENGITLFLRKLSGYARYFNDRHERKGTLFQGRTKKVAIVRHEHFLYVLHYIHLNPLDYMPEAREWRQRDKGTIGNAARALEYLNNYRWSSYLDYCGVKNFPSILSTTLFAQSFDEAYSRHLKTYLVDSSADTAEYQLE